MRRSLQTFLLLGLVSACGGEPVKGEKGDSGERGDPGMGGVKGDPGQVPPSLQVVTPPMLFAGRGALIQVGGVGTGFSAAATVDFGDPGIVVQKIELGSSSNLRVTVQVALTAKLGAHDLTVTTPAAPAGGQGPEQVKLKGGFAVLASLANVAPLGMMTGPTAAQGSLVKVGVRNLDYRDNPFWTATHLSGSFTQVGTVTDFTIARLSALGLVDALAPPGPLPTQVTNLGQLDQTLDYIADAADPAAVQVTARPPTVLTAGVTRTGETLADNYATNLYKLTTTADNQALLLAFTALGTGLNVAYSGVSLVGHMAPASGRFGEGASMLTSGAGGVMGPVTAFDNVLVLPKAGDYYFSIYASDLSGSMNHTYSITAKTATLGALPSLKEPPLGDSPMMPVVNLASLDKPYYGTDGAFDRSFDPDYIKFKADKTGRVYVAAFAAPGPSIDIGIFAADCTTHLVSSDYGSTGTVRDEADVVAGTSYCVQVSGGTTGQSYQLLLVPSL